MATKKSLFKCESTQKAFDVWCGWVDGISHNTEDVHSFYSFTEVYSRNDENVNKRDFVKNTQYG